MFEIIWYFDPEIDDIDHSENSADVKTDAKSAVPVDAKTDAQSAAPTTAKKVLVTIAQHLIHTVKF